MTQTAQFQQGMMLRCGDCGEEFQYPFTRSNNYAKFCLEHRRMRAASSKRQHDKKRASTPPATPPRDVYNRLLEIPDYVMRPVKIIDAAIRECRGS